MKPRFFLDEHISPDVAVGYGKKHSLPLVESIITWEDGSLLGSPDHLLLEWLHDARWVLVTYDQSTIVSLLKSWAEQGISHGGVVFIDERTIPPNDYGGIIRALELLWERDKEEVWENRVVFLCKPRHS